MQSSDWSDLENDVIVDGYFSMLSDELSGRAYNKAAMNRFVQEQTSRSRGSIEFKMCNLSAALRGLGLPTIKGYAPRFNFQISLADAVARWLARHPEWEIALIRKMPTRAEEPAPLFVGVAPTLQNSPPSEEEEQLAHIARRFDVASRDERNRALGSAGEERVFHHERATLNACGRSDLAQRVRWVSKEDGDGLGYDIASFTADGRDRLLEVKTTTGWARTPFHISRNEIEVANERRDHWHLFRLYDFARAPQAFEIRPPLEAHVSLTATSFLARFN